MKKILFFLLILGRLWGIDYSKLDLKYYPYIMFYGKTKDDEIEELVKNVDNGIHKTGVFIGLMTGALNTNVEQDILSKVSFSYGFKLGYQSFLPAFLDTLSYPGIFGMRVYVQYFSMPSQRTLFGIQKISNIALAVDGLIDIPVFKGFDLGFIYGVGVGSMIYNGSANSALSLMTNLGIGFFFLHHNRLDFEFKLLTNGKFDRLEAYYGLGYSYVF
ncbi:hypothetical protein [Helicobacter mustelae]|uniref:Outer membrane protein n=1 Tax=Helicobacter mustelae (strain ATCC 43772 / CCUG 25715 / CIP 103759 / LMG 18044 / NCTC 12198 / R85-136P) TaxID=679897 RepID=D3UG09_HELM1|nr:hypothetical protein [Helicobacter mustelae]CBG39430.1 Putative hypothetical protein [Helicobacter mustelae 12198]SQH70942.1 membrane protein [Helicobacter mustelae]STP12068.1 membrane protein [Helicobacter mustelae]